MSRPSSHPSVGRYLTLPALQIESVGVDLANNAAACPSKLCCSAIGLGGMDLANADTAVPLSLIGSLGMANAGTAMACTFLLSGAPLSPSRGRKPPTVLVGVPHRAEVLRRFGF
jgi:hypothetical protein